MNLLATKWGRLAAFFLLYVTEGLPLGFCAGAIAVYMRRGGVGVDEMGLFIGALYAPWGFKWVAGPVVDLVGSQRLGHRRGWILFAQLVMIVGIAASTLIDFTGQIGLFTAVFVSVMAFAALQDVAIDALAVATLHEDERGLGNGLMFAGAYVGQAIGGPGMLYLAGAAGGLEPAFFAVSGLVGAVWLTVALGMREPPGSAPAVRAPAEVGRAVLSYGRQALRAMLGSKAAIAAAVLAILPASSMALGLALQAALAVEVGLADEEIAQLGLISAIVAAGGSVLGGLISDRTGQRRTLAVYVFLTVLPTGVLAWAMQQHGWILPIPPDDPAARVADPQLVTVFWYASMTYAFCSGLTNGTRMAVFMSVCAPSVAATQFTAYMAGANLAISTSAAWQGALVERVGYPLTLAVDCTAGLLCLAVLPFVRPRARERAAA